jgi:hypothetical protein
MIVETEIPIRSLRLSPSKSFEMRSEFDSLKYF